MTLEEVKERAAAIKEGDSRGADKDDSQLHTDEDMLYLEMLQAIADGSAESPKEMAATAIETEHCTFSRWTS